MKVQELEVKELEVKEPEVQNQKKGSGAEGKEKEIRKSNPIFIFRGNVDIWMAGTLGAGVLVQ